jgi:hypothetical protein
LVPENSSTINQIVKRNKQCCKYNIFTQKFLKQCKQCIGSLKNNLGGVLLRGGGLLKRLGENLLYPEYLRTGSVKSYDIP